VGLDIEVTGSDKMEEEYDVIVIGAGFGGPVAAKKCADAGLKTLMIERAEVPGEKVISSCTIPIYGFLFGPSFIRNGNPPIERPISSITSYFVKNGEIYDELWVGIPKPLAPRVTLGYTVYCKSFCTWLADKAVESGAELRTSTVAVDLIKEDGYIKGIVTDKGEKIRSKILIDAEGTQNLLAINAGLRRRYSPEGIELCTLYDFAMPKEEIDKTDGHTIEYFWAMPEEKMIAPLGHGSAVYIFKYRDSLHLTIGQFLRSGEKVANTSRLLDEYYERFFNTRRWKEVYEPKAELKAKLWDTCPLYVGLFKEMRNMPTCGDGILLIGDSAGLESTAMGDGIPAAWFSAEYAANVAIKAIKSGNTSAAFLKEYDDKLKADPLIQRLISSTQRYDLRKAVEGRDEAKLKKLVRDGWGFNYFIPLLVPLLGAVLNSIIKDPLIAVKWVQMWVRYYRNWQHESYDKLSTNH